MIHRALFGTYQPRLGDQFELQGTHHKVEKNLQIKRVKCQCLGSTLLIRIPKNAVKIGRSITSLKIVRLFWCLGYIKQGPPWSSGLRFFVADEVRSTR